MTADPLQLERHTAFATRLARGLVADENAADDLVQETWLAVLRRPPRDRGAVRGYVATTLRRLAGKARRGESRRARRERDTARAEALPSSAALAAAMEQHQRVVAALLELDEPTRAAILLRYLEDLPPREIAARSGEPVETVRTRIKRGLASLRARLDEREGGRGAWAAALAPLSRAASSGTPLPPAPLGPLAPSAHGVGTTTGVLVMTIKTKLAIAAALVITAGVAWRVLGPRARAVPEPAAPVSSPVFAAKPAEPGGARSVEAPAVGRRAPLDEPGTPPATVTPVAASLAGSIRVVDLEGDVHAAEDGSFTIKAGKAEVAVAVAAGRFALERPATDRVRIGRLELGGRPAFLAARDVDLPAEGPLELVAAWAPPSILRVVDARTGADLDGLTVLRGLLRSRNAVHPGWTGDASAIVARDARSPLELTAFDETESWWVHAPGYTWGWVRFDHRTGGEREVALEPGGADLAVRLDGFDPDLNLWVHVFPAGWERSHGSLVHVRHPDRPVLVFEGLPPGPVQVRAELGIWHDGPHELAREELELASGVRSEVVLDLEQHGAVPAGVPLAGRVVLPAGRAQQGPELDFSFEILPAAGAARRKGDRVYKGRVELRPDPRLPRVRRFDAGLVTPGRYLFVSSSLQFWEAFEVGPAGAPDVEITLPELGEVRLRVVDDATGERLAPERIAWSAGRPGGVSSWTLASVAADPETKEYVFAAPLRRISLSIRWDEYADTPHAIDVGPGTQVHELRVRRLPGAWLRLVDGEATVPIEWSWDVDVTPADGGAEARITRIEKGRAWIAASEPGTYVVELPPLRGFRPVPPRTLELGPGAADELVIRLERR